jgi:hypothetical protein
LRFEGINNLLNQAGFTCRAEAYPVLALFPPTGVVSTERYNFNVNRWSKTPEAVIER